MNCKIAFDLEKFKLNIIFVTLWVKLIQIVLIIIILNSRIIEVISKHDCLHQILIKRFEFYDNVDVVQILHIILK